jgi:hypothetical protein
MLVIEISQKGYTKNEPEPSEKEKSQVLDKVFNSLEKDGITKSDVAKDLKISKLELDKLIFGLSVASIAGGNLGEPQTSQAKLERIK